MGVSDIAVTYKYGEILHARSSLKIIHPLLFITPKQREVTDGRRAQWKFTPAVTAPTVHLVCIAQ